jgi:DNA-binding transcriptional LysR family regulator
LTIGLRQIEAFRAVMLHGSTVRAAEALSITQPAISYLLSALERSVGFALFNRVKRRLVPTSDGLRFFEEVQRVYEGVESFEAVARAIRNHEDSTLRLLLTPALSIGEIVQRVGDFARLHPKLRLIIDTHPRLVIVQKVLNGQADLGVLSLPVDNKPLVTQPLMSRPLVCVFPTGHPLESVAPLDVGALAAYELIGTSADGVVRRESSVLWAQKGLAPRIRIEVRNPQIAIDLVMRGLGPALVSAFGLPVPLPPGVVVRPLHPSREVAVGAIFRGEAGIPEAVRALVRALKDPPG